MTEKNLTHFLNSKIPLTKLMQIQVTSATSESIKISAPLSINNNHMGTAFGGSLSTLMILSCYSWLFTLLEKKGEDFHIVIKDAETKYFSPVKKDLLAVCLRPSDESIKNFVEAYDRKGVGRITLEAYIEDDKGQKACSMKGTFVAK